LEINSFLRIVQALSVFRPVVMMVINAANGLHLMENLMVIVSLKVSPANNNPKTFLF